MTKKRTPLGDLLTASRRIIAAEGRLVVSTGTSLTVSYTIGLTTRLGYELFVVGPPPPAAQKLLNGAADGLVHTDLVDGDFAVGGKLVRLRFLPAGETARTTKRLRMIAAVGYEPQRIRQILIPDAAGVFPGEQGHALPFEQTLEAAGMA